MTYHVIKKVKGHLYLYAQDSWREGAKVRTRSTYIGTVNPVSGAIAKTPKSDMEALRAIGRATRAALAKTMRDGIPADKASIKVEPPKPPARHPTDLPRKQRLSLQKGYTRAPGCLQLRINAAAITASSARVTSLHQKHIASLSQCGIAADKLPRLVVCHGWTNRLRKTWLKDTWSITVSRFGKGRRAALYRNLHDGLARQKLAALETHAPDRFKALSLQLSERAKSTNYALQCYVWNSDTPNSTAKMIGLKLFSHMNPIKLTKRKTMKAAELGLTSYDNAASWRGEAHELLVEISRNGLTKTINAAWLAKRAAEQTSHRARKYETATKAAAQATLFDLRLAKIALLADAFAL